MSTVEAVKKKRGREAIAGQIRKRREALGMSRPQLAKEVGVVRSAVNHWEKGKSVPNGLLIVEVARALGCSIGALYGETPQ
jgi:DNA-binding XRE family transcriptional regulator